MKKKPLGILFLIAFLTLLTSCGSPESNAIKLVKNGCLPPISETKIGKAADVFFEKAKYDAFYADDGNLYVNVYGQVNLKKMQKRILATDVMKENMSKKDAKQAVDGLGILFGSGEVLYQFAVPSEDYFNVYAVTVDGEGLNSSDRMLFLQMLLDDYENLMAYIFYN